MKLWIIRYGFMLTLGKCSLMYTHYRIMFLVFYYSSFSWNTGRRGVVFFGFNHVKFTGINNFCKNIGPSLTILLSLKLDQFGIIVIALYRSVAIGEGKPSITGGNI